MTLAYLAIGSTLAGLVNAETLLTTDTIRIPPGGRVPLVGSVGRRANGVLYRDGFHNGKWQTTAAQEELNAFILGRFGNYTRNSIPLYVSTIDETSHYSPYLCNFERPSTVDETMVIAGGGAFVSPVTFNLLDCILQSVTKVADATITTSELFVNVDTSGGSRTMTLPAVATVSPNVVRTFNKVVAANSMILDANGAELINAATTHTSTALNARVDIYTDGTKWITL